MDKGYKLALLRSANESYQQTYEKVLRIINRKLEMKVSARCHCKKAMLTPIHGVGMWQSLSFRSTEIWGRVSPCCGELSQYGRASSSILGRHPLDGCSSPPRL